MSLNEKDSNEINEMSQTHAKWPKPVHKLFKDKVPQELECILPILEAIEEYIELLEQIQKPTIDIPEIPENDWGEFYTNLTKECVSNVKYGWCLSACMSLPEYRRIGGTTDVQNSKNKQFLEYFEANGFSLYKNEKEYILSSSNKDWEEFYRECFESIESNMFKVCIPSLLTAIEHELKNIGQTEDIGWRLINVIRPKLKEKDETTSFDNIIGSSIVYLLENSLFKNRPFNNSRSNLINRNRVLHGRDNPSAWSKIDAYKLITTISALRLFKEWLLEGPK
ncbi:hypothetical protein NYE33_33680 [Paenibacillus sp. FSL R10-2199]|uniref:hypothetical protein n=1 Tax=Paenibacillus sp. FSL R10-2199 TaxID=2975348 RepID=UPI0030FC1E44